MCVVNSWLLFYNGHDHTMRQATFREKLCKISVKKCFKSRKLSNNIEQQYQLKKKATLHTCHQKKCLFIFHK